MSAQEPATVPRNVARAIVLKNEDIFLLAEHDGGIPHGNQDGFGLYYHDCRFLDGYELRIAGTIPNALVSTADRGSIAEFELTNETLQLSDGRSIPQQTFGITLQRVIDSAQCAVHDQWTIENYDVEEHRLPLSFSFQSAFEDVFEIRGLHPKKIGRANQPRWTDGVLVLSYDGADGVFRRLEVHLDPEPAKTSVSGADFAVKLGAGERQEINLSLRIIEMHDEPGQPHHRGSNAGPAADASDQQAQNWLAEHAETQSDYPLLNHVMRRSLLDLLTLRGSLDNHHYFSAGLPWYGALFGRDSLIASLETLAYEPKIAEQTLRLLAKYQGQKTDEWKDEQPGKILHELRRGELAHLDEIPQTPYFCVFADQDQKQRGRIHRGVFVLCPGMSGGRTLLVSERCGRTTTRSLQPDSAAVASTLRQCRCWMGFCKRHGTLSTIACRKFLAAFHGNSSAYRSVIQLPAIRKLGPPDRSRSC